MFSFTNKTQPVLTEKGMDRIDVYKAALALNFCTVSVSQIVDYDDLYVLEQEYEGILNNLNLKAFPKDDSLLEVLKKILDTITFFRIQEGDKQFIEKDYQQKMKNAIWSAAPNLVAVLATGNPVAMAVTLASQVGIGYMNYRKAKAQNTLEYEKEQWQLQRTAIEQFNVLRRELFTTAWRLARDYDFPDEYRLTEKQISQYNSILMDPDPFRRCERLLAIQEGFDAYPPFLYYLGHAEYEIAKEYESRSNADSNALAIANRYKKKALELFRTFKDIIKDTDILRTNPIAVSCHLEHIELIESDTNNTDEIRELLNLAIKKAGNSFDIIQICALHYLRIGDIKSGEKYLRQCVVEGFNPITNAQILSMLYSYDMLNRKESEEQMASYNSLVRYVGKGYLFPLPTPDQITQKRETVTPQLNDAFLKLQKGILLDKYMLVTEAVLEKYSLLLKRDLQTPDSRREYPDDFYSDENFDERVRQIKNCFKKDYSFRIAQYNIEMCVDSSMRDFLFAILPIIKTIDGQEHGDEFHAADTAEKLIMDAGHYGDLLEIEEQDVERICRISIQKEMSEYVNGRYSAAVQYLIDTKADSIVHISELEGIISNICAKEGISSPVELYHQKYISKNNPPSLPLDNNPFYAGEDSVIARQHDRENERKMVEVLSEAQKNGLILSATASLITENDRIEISKYFSNNQKNLPEIVFEKRKNLEVMAVVTEGKKKSCKKDLVFTKDEVYSFYGKQRQAKYDDLSISSDKKSIEIGIEKSEEFYGYNKIVSIPVLANAISELCLLSSQFSK